MLLGVIPVPAATETVADLSPATAVGVGGALGTPHTGFMRLIHGLAERPTTIFSSA